MFKSLSFLMKSEYLISYLNRKSELSYYLLITYINNYYRCQTLFLSLWDDFLTNEGQQLLSNLHSYPVIIARRIKVKNYNGTFSFYTLKYFFSRLLIYTFHRISCHNIDAFSIDVALGTWFDSVILVDPPIQEVRELKNWYIVLQ